MAKTKAKMKFEEALEKLETIVSQIEQGEIPLADAIDKYADGTKLIKQCRAILESAEKKIQLLTKGSAGEIEPGERIEPPSEV